MTETKTLTPAATRMRRLRARRRRGFRVAYVEVGRQDVRALIDAGLLDRLKADNFAAAEAAIGKVLDRLAGYG